MSGIEKLTPDNHDLYRRVQHLVSLQWKWERIAEDVGLVGPRAVMDLCEWVLEYKEPKKKPMVSAAYVHDVPVRYSPVKKDTERFVAWRKQREGARKALEAMGA